MMKYLYPAVLTFDRTTQPARRSLSVVMVAEKFRAVRTGRKLALQPATKEDDMRTERPPAVRVKYLSSKRLLPGGVRVAEQAGLPHERNRAHQS